MMKKFFSNKRVADVLFILWAGGAVLLSYSLVYALRKPYTAAVFTDLDFFGVDYKIAVTTIQILGYLIAKFVGIKLISELKRERRFKFFISSVIVAQASLVAFGMIEAPYNIFAMFLNGLSLGCMWGVIFSFIEGRRVTDILASLLGISIVFSSGLAKSVGLYVMNEVHVDQFWMPALIGAVALPFLLFLGWALKKLPHPNQTDITHKAERVAMNGQQRKAVFRNYMPILLILFAANFMLLVLRDIKEDFLVNIIDMSNQSSWLFAQVDSIVTLIILGLFGLMIFVKSNIKALMILLSLVTLSTLMMSYVSLNHQTLNLNPIVWLFTQSLSLYIAYLTFQTIFFDRFIACFKFKGNVGYFIAMIDFIGYAGTVIVLFSKELFQIQGNWFELYNGMSAFVGIATSVLFVLAGILLLKRYRATEKPVATNVEELEVNIACG